MPDALDFVYAEQNTMAQVEVSDRYLIVTLQDGRIVHVPLAWFPWLAQATPEQRCYFDNHKVSIYWPDLDEGISLEPIMLGLLRRTQTSPSAR